MTLHASSVTDQRFDWRRSFDVALPRLRPILWLETGLCPPREDLDPLLRPGSVARHAAGAQPLQDLVCVLPYVGGGPQVECELHRRPVTLAEQRPDVRLEPHRLVLPGQ